MKSRTTKTVIKVVPTKAHFSEAQGRDILSLLSPEILAMIANNIKDQLTMSTFSRTSKKFYSLMTPRLYHRIAVAVQYHAHIAKMIRTVEPLLTVEQKKQLKKEGKYKGQQEKYPTSLDPKKVPISASYVNSLVLSHTDPGKKHINFVLRYYEELLKNLTNLEIVETVVANRAICEGIASLTSLKALSVSMYNVRDWKSNEVSPLASVKHLNHFHVVMENDSLKTCQSIIRNSMLTLRSLSIEAYYCHMFQNWLDDVKSASLSAGEATFSELRSLDMHAMMIDKDFIEHFVRLVDLSRLRKMSLKNLDDCELFFSTLTKLMASYKSSNTPICLRSLSVDMYDIEKWNETSETRSAIRAAKISFIASFDTLTTLRVPQYGQYKENVLVNPGLSTQLLQSILKHKNLTDLSINYHGVISNLKIPYVGPKQTEEIVDGLPELRNFEFAPDEAQMDDISKALCRGRNLEQVTCFPHESWAGFPIQRSEPLGTNIVLSILKTFLSQASVDLANDVGSHSFVWENHYKLRRIDLSHNAWDVASDFGKKQKGDPKVERVKIDVQGKTREVCYRQVPPIRYNYDPIFSWTLKVEKDIR